MSNKRHLSRNEQFELKVKKYSTHGLSEHDRALLISVAKKGELWGDEVVTVAYTVCEDTWKKFLRLKEEEKKYA